MEYTEKEKKAIENIKEDFYSYYIGTRYMECNSNNIEILLNLIEKQQKEISRLEKESVDKERAYNECYCEYKHYKQYDSIPKEAIRESLRGINRNIASAKCGKDENYIYAKRILEELLGE